MPAMAQDTCRNAVTGGGYAIWQQLRTDADWLQVAPLDAPMLTPRGSVRGLEDGSAAVATTFIWPRVFADCE